MSSIFRKDDNATPKPKRNTFDLSFQNNLTLNFGIEVPVFVQEVLPGDSFKIEPKFALRYMPQKFPVQTRQRASLKFYYVRNRPLWKDWMDFIGKTKDDLVPPYLDFGDFGHQVLRTSSFADYIGIPCKVPFSRKLLSLTYPLSWGGPGDYRYIPEASSLLSGVPYDSNAVYTTKNVQMTMNLPQEAGWYYLTDFYGGAEGGDIPRPSIDNPFNSHGIRVNSYNNSQIFIRMERIALKYTQAKVGSVSSGVCIAVFRTASGRDVFTRLTSSDLIPTKSVAVKSFDMSTNTFVDVNEELSQFVGYISLGLTQSFPAFDDFVLRGTSQDNPDLCWADVDASDGPYYSSTKNPDGIRLNAFVPRAFQAAYNALIRNAENNPLMINGTPEYNKYILSDAGGAVEAIHLLGNHYYSNWSDDRFTTALPSPQQGNAPLVGLTGTAGATVTLGNSDGSLTTVNLQVDGDGKVVMVEGVSGSDNNPAMTHAFMSAVDYGITINDLRNVNSFQRWLENNIRRGYKYRDQLKAHYGVTARYDTLDMPEFIGGVSRDVNVEQVTSMAATADADLGEYAGQSYIMGKGKGISHFCDEHGFIVAFLSVKPMPLYQDFLPKHFVKHDAFDFYFSEFGKIGMQPITNKELSLGTSFMENKTEGVFGYQRAWYDYLENLDSVHGLFQTDLRNFLIARDFANMPELGSNFLTVHHDDVNNTFYVDDNKDKIIGQIYFNVKAKRPIPLYGVPSLE